MGLKNREIEYKYLAEISVPEFRAFCENRSPLKFLLISGWDHFLFNENDGTSFYRHRVNTNENQLTFKRKLVKDNNYVREERNIDLPLSVTKEKIQDLCDVHGYKPRSSIFKNCFIYNYDYYTLVYYVCYNDQLQELGRFIEIEMKEDYDWSSEEEALQELVTLERLCKGLNIGPQKRIHKSLFEMFGGAT